MYISHGIIGIFSYKTSSEYIDIFFLKDRHKMKGQSEIAYLPKFANMMLIVMVIVITEILYFVLIFDCFENQ